ncbi:MAG: ABC transporter ATP-binding protein [Chloroflexota bacterium]|nr:ABC transporter ATP-binding protein [Chloroflexota bacterium]
MTALLEARHLTKIFGGGLFGRGRRTRALHDFSLRVDTQPPSITAIVGESGSGKTTLANLLLGVISPTLGEVVYRGKSFHAMTSAERRAFRRDVQVIFQDPYDAYNPFYKVDHVLAKPIANFQLARSRRDALKLMEEALEAVGLRPEDTLGRYPHQLSGGQRQRIMVARALLVKPRLIIADEPVSMVDASLRATILGSLRNLNRDFGISIVYITHDVTTAYQISQNVIVLYGGSVAEAGDVELVIQQPQHPYTQLLIGSIPSPNPRHRWIRQAAPSDGAGGAASVTSNGSCSFAARCPFVMPKCRELDPPLFQTDEHRIVACYLHEAAATTDAGVMNEVFVR